MILHVLIAMVAGWFQRHQHQVLTYLIAENRVLKAQLGSRQLRLTDTERRRLATLAHPLGRTRLHEVATIATPDTLLRWYKRLIAEKFDGSTKRQRCGRPRVAEEVEQLVMRMAKENPTWGYRRIQGALANLGHRIDKLAVRNILRRHHMEPAPHRRQAGMSWPQFLTLHWEVLTATACFTEGMETLAKVWTSVMQWGRDLISLCIHLAGLLHHALRGVRTLWLLWQRRWSGLLWLTRPWLAPCDMPWAGVVARRGVGRTEPSCVFARQRLVSRVPQERDPPTARYPGLTITPPRHPWGSSAFGSRLVPTSSVGPHRRLVRRERQQGGSCIDSHQAAA